MLSEIEIAKLELQLMKLETSKREKEISVLERMQDIDRIKKAISDFDIDINRINNKIKTGE